MSTETAAANTATILGGWSPYEPLNAEDKLVFAEAMKGFVGVKYTPEKVSRQVVAGMNYRYLCTASMPPSDVVWQAIVEIFKPLKGAPHITGIIRL